MLDQLQARLPLVSGYDLIQAIRQFRQGGTPQSLSAAVAQVEPELDDELVEPIEVVEPDSFELPPLALVEDEIVLDEAPQAEPEAVLPLIDEVELVIPEDELPVAEPEPQGATLANWH
ncbi:hypothetical protein ACWTQZ_25525, partial [Escherichia coli]